MTSMQKPPPGALDLAGVQWRCAPRTAGGAAVEIADVGGYIAMRSSEDRDVPPLVFTPSEWAAFVAGARDGEFDFSTASAQLTAAPAAGWSMAGRILRSRIQLWLGGGISWQKAQGYAC